MRHLPLIAAALWVSSPAQANEEEFIKAMENFVRAQVTPWVTSDVIVLAVMQQNETTSGLSMAEIMERDRSWQNEIGVSNKPTISSILETDASDYLRRRVESLGGIVSEVIVMDAVGLNAAASSITSDMWQGDEAKFQQTYEVGVDGFHLSEIEYDASTESFQCQVSFTLTNPYNQAPIGAVTIGVNADSFL